MSKSGIILAILAVVVVGCVAMASLMGGKLSKTPETFTVGKEFIYDLAAGKYEEASVLAVTELQNDESRAALEALVQENSDLLNSSTKVSFTGRGIDNDIRYAYGTITAGDIESPIFMEFMDENGETRVSYVSFNEEDIPKYDGSDSGDTSTGE